MSFADASAVPTWAAQAVTTVSAAEIMETYADGSIRPNDPVTREDAVKMLYETMVFLNERGEGALGQPKRLIFGKKALPVGGAFFQCSCGSPG